MPTRTSFARSKTGAKRCPSWQCGGFLGRRAACSHGITNIVTFQELKPLLQTGPVTCF